MTQPDPDTAFKAWWPRQAVRHNSRSPVAAREAFDAGFEAGRAAERQRIRQGSQLRHDMGLNIEGVQHYYRVPADLLDGNGGECADPSQRTCHSCGAVWIGLTNCPRCGKDGDADA